MRSQLIAIACTAWVACSGGSPRPAVERVALDRGYRGLSGIARTDGALVAISERGRRLVEFTPGGEHLRSISLSIAGAASADLESLAWLGDGRLAAGTEGREDGRAADEILVLEVAGTSAAVVDRIALEYRRLGFTARGNQGIEGLCASGGVMLAAFETPVVEGGHRRARIARIAPDRSWIALSLELTSKTGKISALDCRRRGAAVDVVAIERHFEVVRVLHFTVADDLAEGAVIRPAIAADLAELRRPTDNPEGILWIDDRSVYLLLDNDYGSVAGRTELHRVAITIDPP